MMRTPEKSVAYTPVFSTKNKCIYNNNNNKNNSDLKLIKIKVNFQDLYNLTYFFRGSVWLPNYKYI